MEKHDVVISVRAEYLPNQSTPTESRYVFAYHVSMTNCGTEPAKLQTRHWILTNGDEKVQEVKGSGVIGEYPYLQSGESFHYTSGTVMDTVVGSMQGSYQFVADDGTQFDATIRPFSLFVPNTVH